jgi:hypothetical protein
MSEYIKRDDAIHALLSPPITTDAVAIMNIAAALIRIPVADVRENVHAQWILVDDGTYLAYWECSNCHNECYVEGEMRMKYCPACGAIMDGGDDE